jgi:AcrR family transcriptional regulator
MTPAKQALIDSALALFQHEGLHGVGIERILTSAAVSKMTLYKHFPSKDDLTLAALTQHHHAIMAEIVACIGAAPPDLAQQLGALGQWYERRFGDPSLRGCLFVSAASDYPAHDHPIHQIALLHKQSLIHCFASLLRQHGFAQAEQLGLQFITLFEGARSLRQIGIQPDPFLSVEPTIMVLLAVAMQAQAQNP